MNLKTLMLVVAAVLPLAANAQTPPTPYPSKPVRLMVGASPGGGTDIVARLLADKFAESFKGVFVVENAFEDQLAAPHIADPRHFAPVQLRVKLLGRPGGEV